MTTTTDETVVVLSLAHRPGPDCPCSGCSEQRVARAAAAQVTGVGDRFDTLVRRLGDEVRVLTAENLRWCRLFFNAGYFEGRAEGGAAMDRINKILQSRFDKEVQRR